MSEQQVLEMSLVSACKHYFGMKPDQTLSDFSAEFKALTEADKAEIKEYLTKEGYKIK